MGGVEDFDALPGDEARRALLDVCSSPRWAERVAAGRPYGSAAALAQAADRVLAELDEADVDAALAGHPRIGERPGGDQSRREQSRVADGDPVVLAALADANAEYERRFGHVYLVCADGRAAEELLDVLRARLGNDPVTERAVVRREIAAINRLRLERRFAG